MASLRIAFRNLFRHRRRSLLTGLTVLWGCVILAVVLGLTDGTNNRVIDGFARGWTGHIQIHQQDFNGVCYPDTSIADYRSVMKTVAADPRVAGVTARIKVPMFLSAGSKSTNAYVVGIDPATESRTIGLAQRLRAGRYLREGETHSILLGHAMLDRLGIKLGDAVVLIGYGADGSLANGKYTVVGTLETGDPERDGGHAYLPLPEAMTLVALEDRVQELAIVARPDADIEALSSSLQDKLAPAHLRVETWKKFAKGFYRAIQADASTKALGVVIVSFIIGLGVWNTMLMNILERYREFSLMRALGTSRGFVIAMIVGESIFLTVPAALLGMLVGMLVNHWLSIDGIPLAQSLSYGGMQFHALYTAISPRSIYLPVVCVLGAASLVALVSALQAVRVEPAAGLRGT